jgi:internalin A
MTDKERLQHIENIFGFALKPVDFNNIDGKDFYLVHRSKFPISKLRQLECSFKIAHHVAFNEKGQIIGLALDYCPLFSSATDLLLQFKQLKYLSFEGYRLSDYSFLKELKGLTSLDLRDNTTISDYSFFKEIKGLTSLDLSFNYIGCGFILEGLKDLTSLNLSHNNLEFVVLEDIKGLTSLDLSHNRVSDVPMLKELKNLTSLNLSHNNFSDISVLKELKGLTSLDLSHNWLSDVSVLKELKSLTFLDLSNNKNISDYSFLKELKDLTSLDLSFNNKISDYSFLKEIKGLTSLELRYNTTISDYSFLKELKGLTSLDLSNNTTISDYLFLKELKSLTFLDLSRNKNISDCSFLKELQGLTSLYISENNLSNVSYLKEIKGLISLDLSYNNLSDVSVLKEIKGLTSLDLSYNNLSDVSVLKELKDLTSLLLSNNNLSDVSMLKEIKGLTYLYLSSNNLSDVSVLKELKNLTSLDLSYNNLSDVAALKELKDLTTLFLNFNNLSEMNLYLLDLQKLYLLELSYNKITYIDKNWVNSHLNFFWEVDRSGICLKGNPLKSPPLNIAEKGDIEIHNFLKLIEQYGSEKIYEAKILIVGQPAAGKTTLRKKLFNDNYMPESDKSTLGVEVYPNCKFEHTELSNVKISAHLWDFGGQEIQYMLHQYFLTPDSLYILVANDRNEITNYYNWFEMIRLLAYKKNCVEKIPVIVLQNNWENMSASSFDEYKYINEFPELDIKSYVLNLGENDEIWKHIRYKLIPEKLSKLAVVGSEMPKIVKPVKKALEKIKKQNYITLKEFGQIAKKHGVESEEYRQNLLDFFHLLGTALHFKNDMNLNNYVFINPEWITHGLYAALDKNTIKEQKGKFKSDWIHQTWENAGYRSEERNLLLNLMLKEKFDICYTLDNNEFIVPTALPEETPEEAQNWDITNNLNYRYEYDFMPRGLVSRLIVRLFDLIQDEIVWKDGAMLQCCEAKALLKLEKIEGKENIKIKIKGGTIDKQKELLVRIKQEIEKIHSSGFKNISDKVNQIIECNCEVCEKTPKRGTFKLREIEDYLEHQRTTIECREKKGPVNISQLIGAVLNPQEIEELKKKFELIMCKHFGDIDIKIINNLGDNNDIMQGVESSNITVNRNSDIYKQLNEFAKKIITGFEQKIQDLILPEVQRLSEKQSEFALLLSESFESEYEEFSIKELKTMLIGIQEKLSSLPANLKELITTKPADKTEEVVSKLKISIPLFFSFIKYEVEYNLKSKPSWKNFFSHYIKKEKE